ncbi:hypothetical protein SALWKB12_2148 [Snodgrassella communis]|uniref:Uncharacterized protein n=1 Tax=Snodgrassella communis TaxID=2946699 RepID=A0A836MN30_9NEIS|nr:hypothetical protein SALWKB12_2148 [Snodgrassella communis]KDN13923.1 hypothetical protein SALWKB29_2064 [Snodgrassella communis]
MIVLQIKGIIGAVTSDIDNFYTIGGTGISAKSSNIIYSHGGLAGSVTIDKKFIGYAVVIL